MHMNLHNEQKQCIKYGNHNNKSHMIRTLDKYQISQSSQPT